jgi:hypothetical protein
MLNPLFQQVSLQVCRKPVFTVFFGNTLYSSNNSQYEPCIYQFFNFLQRLEPLVQALGPITNLACTGEED